MFLAELDALRVVARCSCGCASIDFIEDRSGPMAVIADFGLRRSDGVPGGVFLFTHGGQLAGLDVYSFGDPIPRVPEPAALDAAPPQIMAKNRETGMARPLCPYPQAAEYKGSGDLKDAANWHCAAPK
jgi:hypothetical protein